MKKVKKKSNCKGSDRDSSDEQDEIKYIDKKKKGFKKELYQTFICQRLILLNY